MTSNKLAFTPQELSNHIPPGIETHFNPVVPTNPTEPPYHLGELPWEGIEA